MTLFRRGKITDMSVENYKKFLKKIKSRLVERSFLFHSDESSGVTFFAKKNTPVYKIKPAVNRDLLEEIHLKRSDESN